jgi:hypoxanthine phosphoribosyltransferase
MIAIGGGGYVPARILRSFLKQPGSPNIPIQAIGLSLYETLPSHHPSGANTPGEIEQLGTKVTRTQWLDLTSLGEMENLVGKRILIVDEVDDTRTTLEYAVKELEKDVEIARQKLGSKGEKTVFSIFVLHVSQCKATTLHHLLTVFCRTKIRRRRALYPRICCPKIDTWRLEPLETFGSVILGRLPTSTSMMRWQRSNQLSR